MCVCARARARVYTCARAYMSVRSMPGTDLSVGDDLGEDLKDVVGGYRPDDHHDDLQSEQGH